MNRFLLFSAILVSSVFLLAFTASAYAAGIAIIVNPANSTATIDQGTVKKMYLKKKSSFDNGNDVVIVDNTNEGIKSDFYEKIVNKNLSQLKAYWAKRVFTGKGKPPLAVDNVKEWVAANKNGLGYIPADQADPSVKVIMNVK